MPRPGNFLVAREGRLLIFILITAAVLAWLNGSLLLVAVFLAAALFSVVLFRIPQCRVPSSPLAIVSPVNGTVKSITNVIDPFLERDAIKIRLAMSLLDVHTIRSPIEGKVLKHWQGRRGVSPWARRYSWWIQTDELDDLVITLSLGLLAAFVKTRFVMGQRVGQGHAQGFLYFAGVVELYLPDRASVQVERGQKLACGQDIVAQFVHD